MRNRSSISTGLPRSTRMYYNTPKSALSSCTHSYPLTLARALPGATTGSNSLKKDIISKVHANCDLFSTVYALIV